MLNGFRIYNLRVCEMFLKLEKRPKDNDVPATGCSDGQMKRRTDGITDGRTGEKVKKARRHFMTVA